MCKAKNEGGMGFGELEAFNFALLAKQGWRLMKNPSSLVARVLQAKYHSGVPFLEAKLGSRVSYVWRIIMEAK